MKKLTFKYFSGITKGQSSKYCEHIIKTENEYWKIENITAEEKIESVSFLVGD